MQSDQRQLPNVEFKSILWTVHSHFCTSGIWHSTAVLLLSTFSEFSSNFHWNAGLPTASYKKCIIDEASNYAKIWYRLFWIAKTLKGTWLFDCYGGSDITLGRNDWGHWMIHFQQCFNSAIDGVCNFSLAWSREHRKSFHMPMNLKMDCHNGKQQNQRYYSL